MDIRGKLLANSSPRVWIERQSEQLTAIGGSSAPYLGAAHPLDTCVVLYMQRPYPFGSKIGICNRCGECRGRRSWPRPYRPGAPFASRRMRLARQHARVQNRDLLRYVPAPGHNSHLVVPAGHRMSETVQL